MKNLKNKIQKALPNERILNTIKIPTPLYRVTTDLNKFRSAVDTAENIYTPNRFWLLQLYQQTILDAHVSACIQQRKNLILSSEFNVYNKDESENEEKSKILKSKWFLDFIGYALDSIYYGLSLIQFDDIINRNGMDEFKEVELVPRQYVRPETHVVTEATSTYEGVDYLELPYANWCIGVGEKRDLGLLLKVTPLVIWKKNAIGAWAEYIEKFGSPMRIGKTNSNDLDSVNNMQNMLENMGTSSWGLFKSDDLIELVESSNSDAFNVFDKMIDRCNSEISKLILGQTMTTDNGSSRSQAEVHERVLDNVGYSDRQLLYNINNNQLIPMLNALGFGFEGLYIDIENENEFSLNEKSAFDLALINTGKFTFTPEYIKNNYGSDVIEVNNESNIKSVSNSLSEYYDTPLPIN